MIDQSRIRDIVAELGDYSGEPLRFMEICGTHTSSIFRHGIRDLLGNSIHLISGPGCPVCVTPAVYIDRALAWARRPGCVVLSFGDMMKVPGSEGESLGQAQGNGARVQIIYAPHEVLTMAGNSPETTFVVAAVGFETTIPSYALLVQEAGRLGLSNIRLLTALKRLMPALHFICRNETDISGYLAPGHVSAILGSEVYIPLAEKYHRPFTVAGFHGEQILVAIFDLVRQCRGKRAEVHNFYPEAVKAEGNLKAQAVIDSCFEPGVAAWRGLGSIEESGFYLKEELREFDGGSFGIEDTTPENPACRCAQVVVGRVAPDECPWFGSVCTPLNPKGPCMVSGEGSCGIWYRYRVPQGTALRR
ncbi:MAG: hydrogenase formation protein HypD [Gracilibacteraceae bacterium]|jgi:hydrogenase expression/formation protein HypD|nr:hydrogenase formation protein HypD [Gracilibacteraceae bacterium]